MSVQGALVSYQEAQPAKNWINWANGNTDVIAVVRGKVNVSVLWLKRVEFNVITIRLLQRIVEYKQYLNAKV